MLIPGSLLTSMTDSDDSSRTDEVSIPTGQFVVVGCGSIGKRHIRNLKHLGVNQVVAVDVRADRRREVLDRFGVPAFGDIPSALAGEAIAALICTPTRFHLEHALLAARSGCHLFIEKPVSDSMEDVDELIEEVERRGLKTFVGCNFRFERGLRHVKRLLDDRAVGKVISARAQFGQYLPDWRPWEDYRETYSAKRSLGGGILLDRIHELDYLLWLMGEVREVCAMMGHLSHLEVDTEDTAEILLRFATGAVGSVHLDFVRRKYDCSLEIVGEAGIINWCYQDHSVRWFLASESRWSEMRWPNCDGNEMYLAEMEHFIRVVQGQETTVMDVASAKRVLAIALAVREAAAEQKAISIQQCVTSRTGIEL